MFSSDEDRPRVVITGIGPVSPRAVSREALWSLYEGDAASQAWTAGPSTCSSGQDHSVLRMTPMPPSEKNSPLRQIDALGRLAVDATDLAWADARMKPLDPDLDEVGIALGSGYGCLASNTTYLEGIGARGSRFGHPVVFQNTVPNAATGYASLAKGIRGPTATFSSGVVAGLEALEFGRDQIREGRAHTMVVGSADQLCGPVVALYASRGGLSASGVCRPFDRGRDGTVLSDGACVLLLEELDRARSRGVPVYAEVLSVGEASDFDAVPWRALTEAIREALDIARLKPEQIDVVFSGANGSIDWDAWESRGLRGALGGHAEEIPVTCPKSHLGDTQAGGGTFAVATAAMALAQGWIPATANYQEMDPDCRVRIHRGGGTFPPASIALVCALSQDGNASAAVLRRYAS